MLKYTIVGNICYQIFKVLWNILLCCKIYYINLDSVLTHSIDFLVGQHCVYFAILTMQYLLMFFIITWELNRCFLCTPIWLFRSPRPQRIDWLLIYLLLFKFSTEDIRVLMKRRELRYRKSWIISRMKTPSLTLGTFYGFWIKKKSALRLYLDFKVKIWAEFEYFYAYMSVSL